MLSASGKLPRNSKVKKRLQDWLEKTYKVQQQITSLIGNSSDIIESLFGNFKHIIERSPQADMNRTTLLIPALCTTRNDYQASLKPCITKCQWAALNIPYTMLSFFMKMISKKQGNIIQVSRDFDFASIV